MEAVWLLCRARPLIDVLERHPSLIHAVVFAATDHPERVPELDRRIAAARGRNALTTALAWLGLTQRAADDISEVVEHLDDDGWTVQDLKVLAAVRADPQLRALLGSPHRLRRSQVSLLAAARDTGMTHVVTRHLVRTTTSPYGGSWLHAMLCVAFDELARSAAASGKSVPRIQSVDHLARLLVERRPRVPTPSAPPALLPGPWGTPETNPDEVALLAMALRQDVPAWEAAARTGHLCCRGTPGGQPTITWLQPEGPRGCITLGGALTATGHPVGRETARHLWRGVEEHNARVRALPTGWRAEDAVAAGLPAKLDTLSSVGRVPLGDLVDGVLMLRE
jgi:hypothetical protein